MKLNIASEALSYEDILLEPAYSEVVSRQDPSLDAGMGALTFKLPIISSPMDTVTGAQMAYAMHKAGGLGIIHRATSIEGQVSMVKEYLRLVEMGDKINGVASEHVKVAIAVGVAGDYQERLLALVAAGANIVCFDTSHGHNSLMANAVRWTKKTFPNLFIIAGSIATVEAYKFLMGLDVDAVRVGVGNGSICSTRLNTGFGIPQVTALHSIENFRELARERNIKTPAVIADGGCRYPGDIVKALALGAEMVMLGSMLAGTRETPGEILDGSQGERKCYRGMASENAQAAFNKGCTSIEGISSSVPYKGPVGFVLERYEMNIKAGLSYAGCETLQKFRHRTFGPRVIRCSSLSSKESDTHILNV